MRWAISITEHANLDEEQGFHNGEHGSFTNTLKKYGVERGQVVAPGVGEFPETSSGWSFSGDVNAIADLVASMLAVEHCSFFAISHAKAKGLLQQCLLRA